MSSTPEGALRILSTQILAVSAVSAQSSPAPVGSHVVRIAGLSAVYIKIGPSPQTATSSDTFIPANTPQYFRIRAGEVVAALQVTTGLTMFLAHMTL